MRDLGSKNGVYLNGERISMEHELKNGDKLSIGPLEFFIHLSVDVKGQKKPKVESISDAVTRTVEIQSANTQSAEKESEIADWLLTPGESDQDQETQTIDASQLLQNIQQQQQEEPAPNQEEAPSASKKPGGDASSRDAAANLLKNFFKGGR